MSLAKQLMNAAEETVLIRDPMNGDKVIVGFRVDRKRCGIASLMVAFNEMVDLAESAAKTS